MYSYNRRQYISREPESKTDKNITEVKDNSDAALKKLAVDSLKLLSENIQEIKNSINKLDSRISELSNRISSLENHFDSNSQQKRMQMHSLPDDTITKYDTEIKQQEAYEPDYDNNIPVMPGSGFAGITVDYLRNLNKKR